MNNVQSIGWLKVIRTTMLTLALVGHSQRDQLYQAFATVEIPPEYGARYGK